MKFLQKNLILLREVKGISQAEMSHQLGFSRTTWNNYERGTSKPSLDDLYRIAAHFGVEMSSILDADLSKHSNLIPKNRIAKKSEKGNLKGNLSGNLIGRNTPFTNNSTPIFREPVAPYEIARMPQVITVDPSGEENVLFIPVKARAGYLLGYSDPGYIEKLPTYRLPGLTNGTFRMFEIEGSSMYDTLHDHDIIIGSFVDNWRNVRDDRVHIVVTKNKGVVVKRVLNRYEKEGKFILKSDNYKDRDQYPSIVCDAEDVLEIWYGIAFMSRQMRPPTETYKRVVDLEGRFTLLEDQLKKLDK